MALQAAQWNTAIWPAGWLIMAIMTGAGSSPQNWHLGRLN